MTTTSAPIPAGTAAADAATRAVAATHRQARCYDCGSPTIAAICCSCRRLVCHDHDHSSVLWRGRVPPETHGPPATHLEPDEKDDPPADDLFAPDRDTDNPETVPSAERRRPNAPKKPTERHFCAGCRPLGRPQDPEVLAAAGEIALGAAVGIWSVWLGGFLAVLGALRIGLRATAGRRRTLDRKRRQGRPALYLDPRLSKLEMTETVAGWLRLVGGVCTTEVSAASGSVKMEAMWSRAHTARVAAYRVKHGLGLADDLRFSAGSLLVRGPGRIALSSGVAKRQHPIVLDLRPKVADHPVLADPDGRGDPRWNLEIPYKLITSASGDRLPVWVTAAISPGSGGRTLDISVQWRFRDADDPWTAIYKVPIADKIEKFRLAVPAAWGDVRSNSPCELFTTTNPIGSVREIEWRRPEMPATKGERGRCQLSVAFERRIVGHGAELDPTIDGHLEMLFTGALSGAERVQVHAAGGARRLDGADCKTRTRVEIDLHMELSGLRFQEVRTVPNPTREIADPARDVADPPGNELLLPGVLPDHITVSRLTDALCQQGYQVMRVIEHPAKGGHGAGAGKGFWDIGGRSYRGVHPVDFTIRLGSEGGAEHDPTSVTTNARLTVRGAYSDDVMENHIVTEHLLLQERIKDCLRPDLTSTASTAMPNYVRQALLTLRHRLLEAARHPDADTDMIAGLLRFIDVELLDHEKPDHEYEL